MLAPRWRASSSGLLALIRRALATVLWTDPWLPVIRRHTGRCVIRPAQIAEFHQDKPVIAIDWPRPDFRIATLEFLTGLLATVFPPKDGDVWLGFWREPPEPAELDAACAPFAFWAAA